MKKITVRDIPDDVYAGLLALKARETRPINYLVVAAIREYVASHPDRTVKHMLELINSRPARTAPARTATRSSAQARADHAFNSSGKCYCDDNHHHGVRRLNCDCCAEWAAKDKQADKPARPASKVTRRYRLDGAAPKGRRS